MSASEERGNLTWARGIVPTPRGNISVVWKQVVGAFYLAVSAPRDTEGVIWLPLRDDTAAVYQDGELVWEAGMPGAWKHVYRGYLRQVVNSTGAKVEFRVVSRYLPTPMWLGLETLGSGVRRLLAMLVGR